MKTDTSRNRALGILSLSIVGALFFGGIGIAKASEYPNPYPSPGTEAPVQSVIVATTGNVIANYNGSGAGFHLQLYLYSPANGFGLIFDNQTNATDDTFNLGSFPVGTELVFGLLVNSQDSLFTGAGSINPDGLVHAYVTQNYPAAGHTWVGFEDLMGGGDFDYDDVTFYFSNTTAQPAATPTPPVCVPSTFVNRLPGNAFGKVFVSGGTIYAIAGALLISTDGGLTATTRTTADGLGHSWLYGVYVTGSTVYVGTYGGLSISTDGGTSFTNRTTANGLGGDWTFEVAVSGNTLYAATVGGVSISTDGGNSFVNKTTANGLGSNIVYGVSASGNFVCAGTTNGVSISTDGGATFTNRTTANGLGNNFVLDVFVVGNTVYAATNGGGLAISTDDGATFTNRTPANGLAGSVITGVFVVGNTVYASTGGGLSISTDGGNVFITRTTAHGLGSNDLSGVFVSGDDVYAPTSWGLSIGTCVGMPTPTPTPPTANIGGSVLFCSNPSLTAVPGVTITLTGGASASTVSNGSGNFSFLGLVSGGSFTVTPSKAPLSPGSAGISTIDILAVQRHFLGISAVSGCRQFAADVNGDGNVTTIDVVATQRFFLGFTTGTANVGKYSFLPASRFLPLASGDNGSLFEAWVFGDVASSFVHREAGSEPNAQGKDTGPNEMSSGAIALPILGLEQSRTDVTTAVLTSEIDRKSRLVGFQGDLRFDERFVRFQNDPVQKAGRTNGNWNVSGNVLPGKGPIRTLRISAYSTDFKPLSGAGTLFELRIARIVDEVGGTPLAWAESPDGFIFIDADLNTQRPVDARSDTVTRANCR